MRNLRAAGLKLVAVWLTAPEEETIQRLRARTRRRLAVSEDEARATYRKGHSRAAGESWDLTIDMSGEPRPSEVVEAIRTLL